jgi:hypothetical protein
MELLARGVVFPRWGRRPLDSLERKLPSLALLRGFSGLSFLERLLKCGIKFRKAKEKQTGYRLIGYSVSPQSLLA